MKTKPLKFRAYADDKRRYWVEVHVFETEQAMQKDISRITGESLKALKPVEGQVNELQRRTSGRRSGVFAIMWMNRKTLNSHGMEVVAHESVHAALRYFDRRGWPVCLVHETTYGSPDKKENWLEERLAYAVGRVARNIARQLFRHKVWQ